MTKKHFITLARAIAALPVASRESIAGPIVAMCREANPLFDESRFRKAAGV